jgi:hypothetical protein
MRKKTTGKTILVLGLFILAAVSLAACGAQDATQSIPTPDLNPIRTEVAATVLAQVPTLLALTTPAAPSPTAAATGTQAAGTTGKNDHATWVSQNVQDETVFTPGQEFTMTWTIKNDGTSTWTANYHLRFYSGDAFGAPKDITLDQEVQPGDTIDITMDMKAPSKAGDYRSDWVLSNESLRNFKDPIFLKIKVATPTATQTKTRTPVAPTSTTTPTETPKP